MAKPQQNPRPIAITKIEISDTRRQVDDATVKKIADSIGKVGLKHPVTVRHDGKGVYRLIAGRHRIEAQKQIGNKTIMANVVDLEGDTARLWEISENLHRAAYATKLERDENIAEWMRLTDSNAPQSGTHKKGQQPGGINAAARILRISKTDAHSAAKVDGLSAEAKVEAQKLGLADNRSAMLEAANEKEPAAQVAKIKERAKAKAEPKAKAKAKAEKSPSAMAKESFLHEASEAADSARIVFEGLVVDIEILDSAANAAKSRSDLHAKLHADHAANCDEVAA